MCEEHKSASKNEYMHKGQCFVEVRKKRVSQDDPRNSVSQNAQHNTLYNST
jgi:hypothetical protein